MTSYLFCLIISLLVTVLPIFIMAHNRAIFVSLEGILVVMGGTVGIALSSYPMHRVKLLLRCMFSVTRREIDNSQVIAKEIIALAQVTQGERGLLQAQVDTIVYPFLKDGVLLILDKLDENLVELLEDRIATKQRDDDSMIAMIKGLSRFPPALGLLATVLSLVTLLQGLGGSNSGMANLGPSMAVGLVGTLYGIVLANLVLSPIAENLAVKSTLEIQNRQLAMLGLLLLSQKKSPLLVQESVNSLLAPHERVDVLGVEGRQSA